MNELKKKIKLFISEKIDITNLADTDDMFKQGFVNSLFAMELVMFVENEIGVKVENKDLMLDNFRSVCAIEKFIMSKK
ncbi:MAG: acyl carrier protein [Prolixibacteraceae bacterium]|nr:acyl carrier protein [Prolixibacteraceae bacterium]MBN2774145.1 acyl carrier protein [Prolixibacteraceae bacterium]